MKKYISNLLSDNPICGISTYIDTLNLSNGIVTRKIYKLVLNGSEPNWRITGTGRMGLVLDTLPRRDVKCVCSHYVGTNKNTYGDLINGECSTSTVGSGNVRELGIYDTTYTTLNDFKNFIQTQYNNNTPVIVWYAMETSTSTSISVPTGLIDIVDGYLNQSGTPTPTVPIYPIANPVTMWAHYTPNIYNSGWTTASGQPEKYNSGWS